jgi:hypothetical protein
VAHAADDIPSIAVAETAAPISSFLIGTPPSFPGITEHNCETLILSKSVSPILCWVNNGLKGLLVTLPDYEIFALPLRRNHRVE